MIMNFQSYRLLFVVAVDHQHEENSSGKAKIILEDDFVQEFTFLVFTYFCFIQPKYVSSNTPWPAILVPTYWVQWDVGSYP